MTSRVADQLAAAGMTPAEAERKAELFDRAGAGLGGGRSAGGSRRRSAWFVPGRIEVLGKHTDYAGGRSLVGAVERGFCFVAEAAGDPFLTLLRTDTGEEVRIPLDPQLAGPAGGWESFPAAVARRMARDFGITRGVRVAFASDLPAAAGLSSGTALTIGAWLALAGANRLVEHPLYRAHLAEPVRLAEYLGCLENGRRFGPFDEGGGVGTLGGCEDQAAILLSEAGTLAQFRFGPVRLERRIRFPEAYTFAIASSGVVAEKTGAARASYNAAARAAGEILERWREATGGGEESLGEVVAGPGGPGGSGGPAARLRAVLADEPRLLVRFEQFLAESEELVPAAGAALAAGDVARLGELVDRSQAGAERGLGNQIPETIALQRAARRLGAVAASAFGAGFGGSVWALVESRAAGRFLEDWRAGYLEAFPSRGSGARFFLTRPMAGALAIAD